MCGVVGVQHFQPGFNATESAIHKILSLQHRGQDSAGMTVLTKDDSFQSLKGMGLIQNALKGWERLGFSQLALAHTRYATTGLGGVAEIQPFVDDLPKLALAFNGNIINTDYLKKKFQLETKSTSDLEILQQLLLKEYLNNKNWSEILKKILPEIEGSFALVGIEESGQLFAFRDPYGIRPLFLAQNASSVVIASETAAFQDFKSSEISEVPAASFVVVNKESGKVSSASYVDKKYKKAACMFELVYFASAQSEFLKKSVYSYRFQLGVELAREILAKNFQANSFDYIVPVPETSRTAAIALAEELKTPYREFLVKNSYVSRTFILGSQKERMKALRAKLSLVGPEIKGKKILLVDDSIVRGNTSKLMVERLKEVGAKSVSLATTCPPVRYGCYYGIDFPDEKELIAQKFKIEEITKQIGVEDLFYISKESLLKALDSQNYCTACLDGDYPTGKEYFKDFLDKRREDRPSH